MLSSVSPKGQVTIPAEIRRHLNVKPRDKVVFRIENGRVLIEPASASLASLYRSVPALNRQLTDTEITAIATEEHARHVAQEGVGG